MATSAIDDIGIDFENVDAAELEQQMELGNKVPAGLWHAALTNCEGPKTIESSGSVYRELTFHVLAGPGKGMDIKDKLFISDATKKRQIIFAARLGLLTKGPDGKYAKVPGKTDYTDVIGAQCVIEVKHEKGGKESKNPDAVYAKLSFEGVLPLDDKRCKDVPMAGTAAAAAAVAAAPKPTKNSDLDGL